MTARAQRHARRPRGPFSRFTEIKSVPDAGLASKIEANPEECAAIAIEIGLPGVTSLVASFDIHRRSGDRFEVRGDLTAKITQTCVVTLDDFESFAKQSIDCTFVPVVPAPQSDRPGLDGLRRGRHMSEQTVAAPSVPGSDDQVDPPDAIIDGIIDLGALAVEFLALACDPYPRKPGAQFEEVVVGDSMPEPSAFAALDRLKDRL